LIFGSKQHGQMGIPNSKNASQQIRSLQSYKGRDNRYVDNNIQEIQELYVDEEMRKEKGKVEDKEVILIKSYKVSTTISSSSQTSFITDEVKNLFKYMKFVRSPTQTRLSKPLPHYQSLKSRGEQDPLFWKKRSCNGVCEPET